MSGQPTSGPEAKPASNGSQRLTRRDGYGRRAVMLGAAAATAGAAVSLAGGTGVAEADTGGAVLLGQRNDATATTEIITSSGNGLDARTSDPGQSGIVGLDTGVAPTSHGVFGSSGSGTGVYGTGGKYGVHGIGTGAANAGVYGQLGSGPIDIWPAGVVGGGGGKNWGVSGSSDQGIGVLAISTKGTALSVAGPASFSTSGVATVTSGATEVTVSAQGVTAGSIVLATPQQAQPGV